MGPLFSLMLLAILGLMAFAAAFLVCAVIWPWRPASIVAFSAVALGGIGAALGLLLQTPFWPKELQGAEPIAYLGVGMLTGVAGAAAGVTLSVRGLKLRPRKHGRG